QFLKPPPGHYFVVVDHRNHIIVMSDTTVDMTGYYAEHDFMTGHAYGVRPQKVVTTTPDTVYAMWAADANADGQVTALDFTAWLAATTAGATGYQPSDFNFDTQVTALDFTKWLANTTAGASTGLTDAQADLLIPRFGGGSTQIGESVQALGAGVGSYVRLHVTSHPPHDHWVNIEAKADSSSLPTNTLSAVVVDVFYDSTELWLEGTEDGVLNSETGYGGQIQQLQKDGHHFIRASYTATKNDYPWHDLATDDWEIIATLHFGKQPPTHSTGLSIRPRTVAIEYYDVHSNMNASYAVHELPVEIQPTK
ncbi:MAG: hypothetical protein WBW88_16430, partial [Rhodothermales bacterium]